jgi:histidinol dehydrogenase
MRVLLPSDVDRGEVLARIGDRQAGPVAEIEAGVRAIIADVRHRGDAAVRELTLRFERRPIEALEVPRAEWEAQARSVAPAVRRAIEAACARVRRFHEPQRAALENYRLDENGIALELQTTPLRRVGLYVPGGSARYPSSVVMTAVPAKVAGVEELIMVTPGASAETLCAALVAGVDRVFAIGGAQAVAALAFGTESVPRVDKIVGPGNAWVAEAKRQVFGAVDIDSVAGPSEILIVADETADPSLLAADLLSQAEHDADAHAILVTPSEALARAAAAEVVAQLAALPRRAIAEEAIRRHGVAIVTRTLDEALAWADEYAPEHLEIVTRDPRAAAARVRTAGAIFLGGSTPEAAGDYLAGPNHVLPTGGAARYASPLGVYDYVKRTSLLEYTPEALAGQAADIVALATIEGLEAHARAVQFRIDRNTTSPSGVGS